MRYAVVASRGVWRSLVARFVRDEEVVGSNPATPTRIIRGQGLRSGTWVGVFFVSVRSWSAMDSSDPARASSRAAETRSRSSVNDGRILTPFRRAGSTRGHLSGVADRTARRGRPPLQRAAGGRCTTCTLNKRLRRIDVLACHTAQVTASGDNTWADRGASASRLLGFRSRTGRRAPELSGRTLSRRSFQSG